MGRLTKVDSLDRYGSEFSHWSGHRGERGRGDFDDVSRTRESCSTHVYNTIDLIRICTCEKYHMTNILSTVNAVTELTRLIWIHST